jgi:flagellar protein FliL
MAEDDVQEDEAGAVAEEGAEGEGEAGAEKKPSIVKLGLLIGLPVLIMLLAGVGGALFFMGGGEDEARLAEEDGEHAGPARDYATYRFSDPVIVQVRAANGAPLLLSMNIELEIADPAMAPVLDERMGRVLDGYAAFLRELTPDDLAGSAGLHRVRMELLRRTNLAIAPRRVEGVLITQMLVTQS